MSSPEDAKRRLREFAEAHDARKSPWSPLLKAAALGAGAGLTARLLGGRRRRSVVGPILVGVPLLARVAAPLVPLVLAYLRSRPPKAPRIRVARRGSIAVRNDGALPNGAPVC